MSKEKFYRALLAVIFLLQSTWGAVFAQTTVFDLGQVVVSKEREGSDPQIAN